MFLLIVLLTVLAVNTGLLYGNSSYKLKNYNINNGLSQNTVYAIFQDNQGFMWFGTKDGLNRFDGTSFKIFKFSPEGILMDNVFHCIVQDRNDKLWVATDDGVYIFDPYREEFSRFENITADGRSVQGFIPDMVVDKDGDIWIASNRSGVFHYNLERDYLDFYPVMIEESSMGTISLCTDNDNYVWVFPYSRPFLSIDKRTKQIKEFQLVSDNTFLFHTGEITDALADQHGRLVLTTSQKGVIRINTANRTHQVLLDRDATGNPLFARTVESIDALTLWIGTESGIYIYDTETGNIENLRHHPAVSGSVSDNAIYEIYKDREEGIWIGTYFGGVDYYSNRFNYFESYYTTDSENSISGNRVREFCAAPDGKIWIGTEDMGLNLFDPDKGTFLPLPQPLQSLYTNIHALYSDGDHFWIGTFSKGLHKYNIKTGEMVTYTHSEDPHSISQNSVFAMCKDSRDVMWIGTLSGLNIYDYRDDNFIRINELKGLAIQDIFEDTDGIIWVSTYSRGVYCFDRESSGWRNFSLEIGKKESLPYNKVTAVFEDSAKRLWVATQGGGFSLFDKEQEFFTTYNTTNGMPNDVVYQIVEDDEANLWLSTNAGLVKFNPETKTFKNYTVDNGLRTNQFNYKSSYKTPDGTIYFGSINGFTRFNPSTFREPEIEIPIVFTELTINGEIIHPGAEKSLLKKSVLYTDTLVLAHNKNSLRLEYAVLNYCQYTAANSVMYKLDGFDREWNEAKDKQYIIYSNLKPGKYLLSVKLNEDSVGNRTENIKTLAIRVYPPFWLSGWAYFSYIVLLIMAVLFLLRFLGARNRKIQRRQMRIFEQQKERELYRSKIDFFTNVAHDIRTPLSLIKAPLGHVLMTGDMSDDVKENLQIMSKNTDRLLDLTNQLLDFRKTESEAYTLTLSSVNVAVLIRETFLRFSPLAEQRGIDFQLDLPQEDLFIRIDKEALLKIFSNLLNNAIKYCDAHVRVHVYMETSENNNWFHLITENDGEKIPDLHREDIFKPFVQLDRTKKSKVAGTGIGLALSKSLAELHRGNLTLEVNEENEWIRFHLTIPADEIEDTLTELTGKPENEKEPEKVNPTKKTMTATILLVEDDPELLQFEEKVLSPHYHVVTAKNGMEALEVLRETAVNLIVSDVMMPKMDGLEFTAKVKSDVEFSHIPVILLTAKVNVESRVHGFETGADAYIDKPFALELLMAQIANLLESREKLREKYLQNPFTGANSIVQSKSDKDFLKQLHTIIQENLENPKFIVEDIADQFNMSRASFYRKINGVLNLTPNEYIKVERLKKAAQLLREKNYKVNEICYMVGFNSPSYFTKCFQQQFGVLPKEFA